jgi:hypothetical protein
MLVSLGWSVATSTLGLTYDHLILPLFVPFVVCPYLNRTFAVFYLSILE